MSRFGGEFGRKPSLAAILRFLFGNLAKIEGQSDYSMGSKHYEALQFQKPILGVCGPSPLADLIQKSGLGVVLDPDDARESA